MSLVIVLILIALAYAAYHFREQLSSLLSKVQKAKDPVGNAAPQSPSPQVAPSVAPQAPAKPATGSDNPWLDAYKQSNPQYVEPSKGPVTPAIDLSAPELDFAKVQGGVHIPLPKTITGCPDKVNVMAVITVNSGGVEKYTITVNGQSVTVPNAQNEFISANYFPVSGPTVTVSADVPMEMMIYRG